MANDSFAENVWPIDGLLTYMTPAIGFGQRLKLETIDRRLARFRLGDVLLACAVIAHLADGSMNDRHGQYALARGFLPPDVLPKALAAMDSDPTLAPFASQQALMLATRALVVCPDEPSTPTPPDQILGGLTLAIGDHLSYRENSNSDLLLDLVRGGLFYRLTGIMDWYSTTEALFFRTMPAMADHPEYVDVVQVVERLAGFPLDVFWALNACYGFYALHNDKLQTFPFPLDTASSTDPALVQRWLELNVLPTNVGRRSAAADLARRSPWSFTTFINRPLVEISPGSYVPIRTQLLALKATTAGMFYFIFDLLKEAGEDHLRWSRFMGHAVEAHGHRLLRDLLPTEVVVSFPEVERAGNAARLPKACDALVDYGDSVIAIDFVHRNLTLATQATGGVNDLEVDLRRAVQEKIEQIDATLERGAAREDTVKRIFPIIVTGAPLPLNPLVHGEIDRLVQASGPKVVGVDRRCRQLGILELYELGMLMRTATANDMTVPDLLDRWYSTPLRSNNFRDWVVRTTLTVAAVEPGADWENRAFSILR